MKLYALEAQRGFAVLIVVLYHMYAAQDKYFTYNIFPDILALGAWGVDIFFVISGSVMYRSAFHTDRPISSWHFLKKRIARIYPAYWLITLLVYIVYIIRPELVNSSYDRTPSIVKSVLLYPDFSHPWLNVGWSLVYEMWFYLLLSGLLFLKKQVAILMLGLYAIILAVLGDTSWSRPELKLVFDPIILEFLFGLVLGAIAFNFQRRRRAVMLILFAAIGALGFYSFSSDIYSELFSGKDRFLTFGTLALVAVSISLLFEHYISLHSFLNPIILLGKISYSLYLTHVVSLSFFFKCISSLPIGSEHIIIYNTLCLIFIVLVGWIYYIAIEQPLSSKLNRLITRSSPS